MTIEEVVERLDGIRRAAFMQNSSAVSTLRCKLYTDLIRHVSEAGDDYMRALAFAALEAEEIEIL